MILADLVKVFSITLIAVTAMFVATELIQEALRKGLSPMQTISAIPFFIPDLLPFSIPATTLFTTSLVYGRMSADSEVLALRASGMNVYRLIWPAVLLGSVTTLWSGFMYYETIPRTRVLLREHVLADAEGVMYRLIQRDGGMRDAEFVLYVREVQGRDLIDVIFKQYKSDHSGFSQVIWASSATIRVEFRPAEALRRAKPPEKTARPVESKKGTDPKAKSDQAPTPVGMPSRGGHEVIVCMSRCSWVSTDGKTSGHADYLEFATQLPEAVFGQETRGRPSTQTWQELFVYREEVAKARVERIREVEELEAQSNMVSGDRSLELKKKAAFTRDIEVRYLTRLFRGIESEMNMRPALAVGCFCFALVGCPVGIGARRSDYLGLFVMCFMPVTAVYYPVLIVGLQLSNQGRMPPAVFWLPDLIIFLASLTLIRLLIKR